MKNSTININYSANTLEIDYDFIYNFYEENETLTEDIFLKNNETNYQKSKYISLELKFINKQYSTFGPFGNDYSSSINVEFFRGLSQKSLSNENRESFNTLNKIDNQIYYNEDSRNSKYFDKNDLDKTFKFYNVNSNFSDEIKEFYRDSNAVYFNKKRLKQIESTKNNTKILQKKNCDNLLTYNNLFELEKYKENTSTSIVNYIPNIEEEILYYTELNEDNSSVNKQKIFIGLLIDKFSKSDESTYNLNSSKFYFADKYYENFNKSIIDDGVKYGKTYKYVIYPVYFYSRVTINEGTTLTNYLICDIPSITEDIECIENKRPMYVGNIRGKYFENTKGLLLKWSMPPESQRDIKGFQIFKRSSLNDPFSLVKQLESHKKSDFYTRNNNISKEEVILDENILYTEYFDESFNPSEISIYTICCIDAHGLVSNYSEQIAFTYDYLNKKTIADLVSTPGAPIFYPNILIPRKTMFFDNDDKISTITPTAENKKKFTLIIAPDCYKHNTESSGDKLSEVYKDSYDLSIFRLNNRSIYEDRINFKYNNQE
tara:strand:+ start:1297 stop:2931 length:1635 start_codon:yes stop_codon:yes gene_type:complete